MKKVLICFYLFISFVSQAQEAKEISWLTFEELEVKLNEQPQKTFIYFFTDWCVYCKKMERNAFKNEAVKKLLAEKYYAVKLNAETKQPILFDGQIFRNKNKGRISYHDLALLLGSRENKAFSLPVILILNENFEVEKRIFHYLTSEDLLNLLSD